MKLQDVIQLVENPPENVAEITWELNSTVEDRGLEFLGNLSNAEQTYFMLYLIWPMGGSIIPFCIYFALFTKPRFVNNKRMEP